ncbi:unnamed protein product [Effrenium voratum]|nr:unnamed protein product [Effrenium voratum]
MAESHAEERGVPWPRPRDLTRGRGVAARVPVCQVLIRLPLPVALFEGDATGVVRSNLWLDGCLAFAVILLAALCCYCRRSPKTRVARWHEQELRQGARSCPETEPMFRCRSVLPEAVTQPKMPKRQGRGAGAMARKRSMWQCLVLGCLCTQLSSLDFLGARQLPRRLGALFLATVVVGSGHDAQAARLVRDKGEAVLDPKTGQKVVPPCEKVCNKECLAIVGQVNEKNVAYCQKRCQDDCAAGDGFGATETFIDADMPRVSKDSEKSPVERFAEWGAEANVQMMEFMKPPGAAPDLQPDSLSAGDDVPAASRAEIAKPLLDARQLLKPK